MRRVIVLGASSSLAVRLAAELATHDVQVIVAEGKETAVAAARALDLDDAKAIVMAHDAAEDARLAISEDVLIVGGGSRLSLAMQGLALELSRYEVAEPLIEPYMLPRTQPSYPYWQQGTPAFHRKQQSMRAKARRR